MAKKAVKKPVARIPAGLALILKPIIMDAISKALDAAFVKL